MNREKRLERAQMRILLHLPFFAPAVCRLPVVFDDTIDTACTDGTRIRFSPKFFDECDDRVVATVLCHEAAHCLAGHLWRVPPTPDWGVWNEATDHAINTMLREFADQMVGKNLADPFPMPKGNICCDPQFAGMAEEAIYRKLITSRPPGGKGKGKGKGGGGQGGIGQIQPSPDPDPVAQKKAAADWDGVLIQSVAAAKGRGDLPGSVARLIDGILHPKVPWVELLRQFLREQAQDDWDWMKPNQYFGDSEFLLPSLNSESMGSVIFAVDSSGSIDQTLLKTFKSEMQGCLDDLKPAELVEIICDTRITREHSYRQGDKILPDAPGGGGTSFVPVFDRIAGRDQAPKCVVYLTDLDGTFPDVEPDYPVLWVSYGTDQQAPFGETVKAS